MRAREWQRETSDGSAWSSWASPVAEKFSASGWQWPTASYSGPTTSRVVEQPVSARFLRASLHAAHGSPLRHPSPSMGPTAAIVPSSSLGPPLPGPVEGRPCHRRSERQLRSGEWSRSGGTAWAEHGESRQGREYTQRTGGRSRRANAVEGNQTGDLHEPDLQRTQRHTSPYTAPRSRSPLAWRRVEMPVSPRASSATRPFSYTFPHTAPRPRSPLAWGRASNPPVPLRGGG